MRKAFQKYFGDDLIKGNFGLISLDLDSATIRVKGRQQKESFETSSAINSNGCSRIIWVEEKSSLVA